MVNSIASIASLSQASLHLIGVALYWAEGAKEKSYNPQALVSFSNTDPMMIVVFLHWLRLLKVTALSIKFEIYIHEMYRNRQESVIQYWKKITKYNNSKYVVYYKKHRLKPTNRKNIGDLYYGVLRVRVMKSSILLRQIQGWTQGIIQQIERIK